MNPLHLVHVSTFPPTQCGIAEYTAALTHHLRAIEGSVSPFFIKLECGSGTAARANGSIAIDPLDNAAFIQAADAVNRLEEKAVLLQHEFKLYGTEDGGNLLPFLDRLRAPVTTTLHTVRPSLPPARHHVFLDVLRQSGLLVVFSSIAAQILSKSYGMPAEKVRVIPHGVPDVPFQTPGEGERAAVADNRVRFITCGLLRPTKGIELALGALAELKKGFRSFVYLVCGTDHPRNPDTLCYRKQLETLVNRYDLREHVVFENRFFGRTEFVKAVQACDVGILPYTSPEQSSSGILALMLACGRPVIATDFQYARATVDRRRGILVPMGDVHALAAAMESLASDATRRKRMAEASYCSTRDWVWRVVAQRHLEFLDEISLSPLH